LAGGVRSFEFLVLSFELMNGLGPGGFLVRKRRFFRFFGIFGGYERFLQLFEQGLIAENAENGEIPSLRKLRVNSRVNGGCCRKSAVRDVQCCGAAWPRSK